MKPFMLLTASWAIFFAAHPTSAQELVAPAELEQLGYYKYWNVQLPLIEDEHIVNFYLVKENLYCTSNMSVLYAVHADIGTLRWAIKLGGPGTVIFEPYRVQAFFGQSLTLVTTTHGVHWLDTATGKEVARENLNFVPVAGAVSDGVRFYVPGLDRNMHSRRFIPVGQALQIIENWRVATEGLTYTPPKLWGGGLFWINEDGRIRACFAENKQRLWVFNAAAPNKAGLFVDSTGLFFGSTDYHLYKLDVMNGKPLWRYRVPNQMNAAPIVIGESVYQMVENNGVYALDVNTGDLLWQHPLVTSFISAPADRVNWYTQLGDIVSVDPHNGVVRGQIYAGEVELIAGNTNSGAMYLGNRSGHILCAQQNNVPYLRFEQLLITPGSPAAEPTPATPAATQTDEQAQQEEDLTDLLRSRNDDE
ncbi:MAG: Outer membrane protein assembly factor BamB [Phycisphaerae bacterium]|nr:Outer membrane protein assembly factor BamB [Phycisphaerae bacterium]